MDSSSSSMAKAEKKDHRPHAVLVPYPAQGHVNPMMNLAKLLHHHGFHITFVNTEYNHWRLLKSRGPSSLDGASSFRFASIPDGLPLSDDVDAPQDVFSLTVSITRTCLGPFKELLAELDDDEDVPPVTCIVWDSIMAFALDAAQQLCIPDVLFWIASACGFLPFLHFPRLVDDGLLPLKDKSDITHEQLDTTQVDWIPGMEGMRLRDIPCFLRDPIESLFINYLVGESKRYRRASALVLNTFHALEQSCVDAISSVLPYPVYSIGSLQLLLNQTHQNDDVNNIGSNLWKEDHSCLQWLDAKEPNSVLYVNFGTLAKMTPDQLTELAWGLANSKKSFLWVVRPDLVAGQSTLPIPPELLTAVGERGLVASWCPQVQVLNHPAVGGFLTHCGWNSVLETICAGVPVICWPFFADQHTICRYLCVEWGIGLEIDYNDVKRGDVEKLVIELMEGERGNEMKKRVLEWKEKAHEAAVLGRGSSQLKLAKVISLMSGQKVNENK